MICFAVESDDLDHRLIGFVEILVFQVEQRIDPVFVHERTNAAFPTKTREDCAVSEGRLSINVELRCPPCFHAVLELGYSGEKIVAVALSGEDRIEFDFKISRLLKMVRIRDEVRWLLPAGSKGARCHGQHKAKRKQSQPRVDTKKQQARAQDQQTGSS